MRYFVILALVAIVVAPMALKNGVYKGVVRIMTPRRSMPVFLLSFGLPLVQMKN